MPPYRIHADAACGILRVVVTGAIDHTIGARMVSEARAAASASGYGGILYDMRESEPTNVTSASLFWMPRQVEALKGPQAARTRVALLHPARFASMAAHWETAFTNAGLRVKGFAEDEPAAVAWLTAAANA